MFVCFYHFELFKDVIYDNKNLVIDVNIQIVPTINDDQMHI